MKVQRHFSQLYDDEEDPHMRTLVNMIAGMKTDHMFAKTPATGGDGSHTKATFKPALELERDVYAKAKLMLERGDDRSHAFLAFFFWPCVLTQDHRGRPRRTPRLTTATTAPGSGAG